MSERKDWRIGVEAAKPGASAPRPVRYTPGPVDVKSYEASHGSNDLNGLAGRFVEGGVHYRIRVQGDGLVVGSHK